MKNLGNLHFHTRESRKKQNQFDWELTEGYDAIFENTASDQFSDFVTRLVPRSGFASTSHGAHVVSSGSGGLEINRGLCGDVCKCSSLDDEARALALVFWLPRIAQGTWPCVVARDAASFVSRVATAVVCLAFSAHLPTGRARPKTAEPHAHVRDPPAVQKIMHQNRYWIKRHNIFVRPNS